MNDVYFHLSKNFYKCEIERQKYMISKLIMHFNHAFPWTIYTTLANFIEEC